MYCLGSPVPLELWTGGLHSGYPFEEVLPLKNGENTSSRVGNMVEILQEFLKSKKCPESSADLSGTSCGLSFLHY